MLAEALLTVNPAGGKFLYDWGNDTFGQLGDNYIEIVPQQVGGTRAVGISTVLQSWTSISIGLSHTAAIRSDGLLFTWGFNNAGQLGDGTITNRSSPVQKIGRAHV